jgi:uncharacterized protein (TIGR02391 family)
MATIPEFAPANLQALCDILGDTSSGLTGSEIKNYLAACNIFDPDPTLTKRHRLYIALSTKQNNDGCANHVIAFIQMAMNPVKHVHSPDYFEAEREKLNSALIFSGLKLRKDGAIETVTAARTLNEAQERAGVLRRALKDRKVHLDVLKFCRAELLDENYFHAVFEAAKSLAEKIRMLAGVSTDGGELVDNAFSFGSAAHPHPRLAFNSLTTESEKSEQRGLMNLLKGIFGAFRNTTAHAPRIHWNVTEQDALDILTTISLMHRRLDQAVRTHVP